jgi:hypothetical protein
MVDPLLGKERPDVGLLYKVKFVAGACDDIGVSMILQLAHDC